MLAVQRPVYIWQTSDQIPFHLAEPGLLRRFTVNYSRRTVMIGTFIVFTRVGFCCAFESSIGSQSWGSGTSLVPSFACSFALSRIFVHLARHCFLPITKWK